MTFIDTNVLLDVLKSDPVWGAWSERQLAMAAARGPLMADDTVFAELCVGSTTLDDAEAILATAGIQTAACPRPGLFLAAKAYLAYRAPGGTRTGVLPDFFIGAHAAIVGAPLVTRDASRFRTYFPSLELIAP